MDDDFCQRIISIELAPTNSTSEQLFFLGKSPVLMDFVRVIATVLWDHQY